MGSILLDDQEEISKLEKISHKISDNYRMILPIYGILLAFVVSDKILLVFRSAFFVMWTGMVIALIVRAGGISIELSDVIETKSLAHTRKKIIAAKKFFSFSLSMLILTVALLPGFFLIPNLTDPEKSNLVTNFYSTIF